MEVGPTCHYVMGGIEVDPDTGAADDAGPVRRRRVLRRHARLQPARWQLAVRSAGVRPARRARRRRLRARTRRPAEGDRGTPSTTRRSWRCIRSRARPTATPPENPYTLQLDLQDTMNNLVGIIRKADEMHRGARQAQGTARTVQAGPGRG